MDINHTAAYGRPMVRNVHERSYPVDPERLGELLDRVAGSDSPLWPVDRWPAMILDRPLGVGAAGGHGPIRYRCTAYRPGRLVEFTFAPGFWARGTHTLEVLDPATLRHTMTFRPRGAGHLLWPLAFRWLHDACLEDLLDRAGDALGHPPAERVRWSPWVRLLRRLAARGARRAQSLRSASST
jgi:hypothetical protein